MNTLLIVTLLTGLMSGKTLVQTELFCDGRDLRTLMVQLLTLRQEFTDYKQKSETIIEGLKEAQTNITKELQALKDSSKYDTVGFIVTTQSDSTCNGTVRFETTVMNNGSAYNPNNGYFTAPYSGMYLFSIQLCLIGDSYGKFAYFYLYSPTRDQYYSASLYLHETYNSCSSMATTAYLSKNDQIYVTCTGQGRLVGTSDTGAWTMFTGVLVN